MTNDMSESTDASDDLNEKLTAAGRPTVTDKRTPKTEADIDSYQCPFCDYQAQNERLVRAHITKESRGRHRNRNGYPDQVVVHALDTDGNVILERSQRDDPSRWSGTMSTEYIPEDATDKQRHILDIALRNPSATQKDIAERCADEHGYEPSSGYVSRTLSDYLTIDGAEDPTQKQPDRKKYDDLTDKQQAVVDEVIQFENPLDRDAWPTSVAEVSRRVGCAERSPDTSFKARMSNGGSHVRRVFRR